MKNKTNAILPALALLSLLASCTQEPSTSSSPSTVSPSLSTGSAAGGDSSSFTPSTDKADKSDLPYVSSLDSAKKEDFEANWIWDSRSVSDSYVAFRKDFTLDKVPEEATAYLSAESKYYLWVNGELVVYDGSSKRGPTLYDSYYETIDLSPYLQTGENVLAFLVVYNGRSGNSSIDPGQAGLLFEMDLGEEKILSDSSFKVQRLREYKNQTLLRNDYPNYPQADMLAERNVYYDARDSIGEFMDPEFDDSSWSEATIVGYPGCQPFNDLYECPIPQMAFDDIQWLALPKEYENVALQEKTTIEIDLPENMQFSPVFTLEADQGGRRITYYTDTFESQGMGSFKDDYIAKEGTQDYESYPWRTGNTLILEVDAGITLKKVGYRRSYYPSEEVGRFQTGEKDLDTLFQKAQNTLSICMRDTYMDCPERERSPYLGDAANQIGMSFYALDTESHKMTKKTILTLLGWIKEDHILPTRSPSKTTNECPAQNLAFLVATRDYYLNTGDAETMKLFYPAMIEYLKLWSMGEDGLPENRIGSFLWTDWGIGTDENLVQTCFYYYALTTARKLADDLSISNENAFLDERIDSIEKNFRSVYYDGTAFRAPAYSGEYDDRGNAMVVVSGLAMTEDYPGILNVLKSVETASPYMEKYVLEALCLMGETAYSKERMLKRYQEMIQDEGSTLFELWHKDEGTVNHGWTGGPLTIMGRYYAGVYPVKAGYEIYDICPSDILDNFSSSFETVRGTIALSYKKGTSLTIDTIKADGHLYLPESFDGDITISGDEYEDLRESEGYLLLKGGHYEIRVTK